MLEFLKNLLTSGQFIPHGHCYLWQPALVWLHIISDSLIALAYYSIPIALVYFVRKRQDLPFNWIFVLFGAFIIACGTTHIMEIWTIWRPMYWLSGLIKAITAVVSLYTALALVPLVPKALALPSPAQLETVNRELQQQMTERLQAEAALQKANEELLQKSQERLELAQKIGKIGTFEWNIQTNETIWTEELEVLYGQAPGAFSGKYNFWAQAVYPDDLARVEQEIQRAINEGLDLDTEYRIRWHDGEEHWIAVKGQVFHDRNNKPLRMIGVNMDITERKRAEQKIREQAALLNITKDAILVRSLNEHKILFWNKGAEDLYGWTAEEALSKNANTLLYDDKTVLNLESAKETVILKGSWQGELHQRAQNKREIIVSSRWTLMNDWFKQPVSILVVNTDITEAKKLEAQSLRTQRLESIGTLASGIAHDLNNVLTPIIASAQLILHTKLPEEKKQKLLTTVELSAKRGAALVKQVLQFARGIESQSTMVQIKDLLEEFQQVAFETFPKSIEICVKMASNLGVVLGDVTQLQQVFLNLCVNARDAMVNGGVLSISAENIFVDENFVRMNPEAKVGSYIVVTVTDTGVGIPSEIMDRIFEPFFTTKEHGKGTGLGLATVFGITKNHGGFIKVYSEVGRGTQFKVYLPALEGSISYVAEDSEMIAGNGELILFVDDEQAIREISKSLLQAHNYKVLTGCDGIEAIALYVQHQQEINAVVMDIMMPSLGGIDTMRALQTINPSVKIIAISGLESNQNIADNPEITCVKAFLPKPYTMPALLKSLHSVLNVNNS
ncbi:hybrid sensor histidine kinase/response regulator [Scytonema hofmannii PCC 7110]|uniref:histidine kinase n=1 Tax=Scytonema hofmannii PCC 7110 TaxID=128403 RepID=A0A139WT86_9CYAN|nr:hybrid sensor histidine kinase/response regulator [Scytonema hofmannii PCC 7110]